VRSRVALAAWLALGVALLAIAAVGLERTDDLARLLPSEGSLSRAASVALSGRAADVILIEVDGSGADRAALRAAVDAVTAEAEATGRFARVRGHRDPLGDGQALRDVAVRHGVALLPEDILRERTSEAGVAAALRGWQARLLGPAGALAVRGVQDDPLDLGGLVLTRMRADGGPWRVRPEGGLLLDSGGERALILARPRRTALAAAEDPELARAMDAVAAASPLPARWFGGPRVATDMAASIRRDAALGGALSVGALIAVLALGFRSVGPLLGLLFPAALTVGAVGAALALRSPIHGISLGFGGALLGIAVDYWVHLYVAAAGRGGRTPDEREAAAREAWREVRGPMLLAAATTVCAFAILLLSRFPVVRDLGASGIAAIVGAIAGTALIGPLAYRWTGGAPPRPQTLGTPPLPVAWAVIAGVAALGLLAVGVRFDGDPRRLIAVSNETRALEQELAARYGGIGTGGVVVVEAAEPGRALDLAAEAEAALGSVPGATVTGPTSLLPGPALEARRRNALPPAPVLRARVEAAAAEVGLDPAALLPAIDRLYEAPPLTAEAWADTPLAELVERAVGEQGVTLEVVLADPALASAAAARLPPGATLVVPTALAAEGTAEIRDELLRLGGLATAAVALLLIARFRRPRPVLAAAAPVAAALAATLGALALLDWPLDAVGTSVLVLILGLAVDYGVFLADGPRHARGVTLAAATSIAGFGPLALSRSPGLASAGLVVAVGLGAAALTAVVVTPRIADGTLLAPLRGRRWVRGGLAGAVVALNVQVLLVLRFVAPPPEVAVDVTASVPDGDDRRVPNGRLLRAQGLWTLAVSGTHAEMGAAHGLLTRDLRERLEAETFAAFGRAVPNPLARAAILEGVIVAGAGLDAHVDDRWRRELAGMVRATPDPRAWLLPAYTRKLYFHALHDIGQALVDSPLVACTGLLATGSATSGGHTLLARTFDFEGGDTFDTDKVVTVRRPTDGLATVSVAFPGMVGVVTGINERRIAVALQAAGSEAAPRMAEPMTLVLRQVLEEAESLDDVQEILDRERGFGTELVLAADGVRGEAAVFEVTPERVARLPAGDLLGVANHFRTEALAPDPENQRRIEAQTTAVRLARAEELLEAFREGAPPKAFREGAPPKARRGTLDLPAAVEILRDRAAPGGAPLARGHRWAIDADIASHAVAFDVTAGTLWVSVAPNLSGGFVAYELDDLLAGDLEPRPAVGPTDVAAALRTHRARALLREARHAGDPEPLLEEALRHMPDHPEVLIRLAEVAADPQEARALLERAAAAPPEDEGDRARLEALQAEVAP
jgi:predicted exporter